MRKSACATETGFYLLIYLFLMICWESNLSAEVDDSSVGVIKRQKDAATGVQLLQGQGLAKVVLLKMIETDSQIYTHGLIQSNPMWNNALALVKQGCKNKSIKAGCSGKLKPGVSILMKVHRKGKITACRADLIGFMGQSVSGSKQEVFFRLAPMRR